MSTGTTTEQVNPVQLCVLLGVPTISVGGTEAATSRTVTADVDQATMDSALTSYVYDPNYIPPNAPPAQQNAANLRQKALTALTNNQTYLGIAAPTNTQAVTQVAALTRQVDGIIRLLLNQLDTTSGT